MHFNVEIDDLDFIADGLKWTISSGLFTHTFDDTRKHSFSISFEADITPADMRF
jgi:hypothetical protein